jgi:hypothetical protein
VPRNFLILLGLAPIVNVQLTRILLANRRLVPDDAALAPSVEDKSCTVSGCCRVLFSRWWCSRLRG